MIIFFYQDFNQLFVGYYRIHTATFNLSHQVNQRTENQAASKKINRNTE